MFESVERFQLSIFPAGFDRRFLEVIPELSTTFVYIVDDEGKDQMDNLFTVALDSM